MTSEEQIEKLEDAKEQLLLWIENHRGRCHQEFRENCKYESEVQRKLTIINSEIRDIMMAEKVFPKRVKKEKSFNFLEELQRL